MPGKVLIVEDDPMIRALEKVLLRDTGYEVHECERGDAALAKALEVEPDLVLLDIGLPGLDGLDVLEQLKAEPQLADVDVFIITAWDDAEKMDRALSAGARRYLRKPFDNDHFLASVVESVEQRAARGGPGASATDRRA